MIKRKYLYRLAMSVFFIILLPMFIFIVCFGKYSYEKVEAANEEYQEALMEHYMTQLDQVVMELKEYTALICANSKSSSSIFWENDLQDNYWYYQVITELQKKYNNFTSSDFGIYFYENDSVVSSNGKISSEGYFHKLEIKNLEKEEYLKNFFSEENYEEFVMTVGGTELQEEGKNIMLFGFYTTLGRRRDKVLVFYQYSEKDLEHFFESVYIEEGLECSLWNKNNGFSFYFSNYSKDDYKESVEKLLQAEGTLYTQDKFLVKQSQLHPIVFIGYMNENAPRNVALAFLDNMLAAVSAVLVFVLLGYLVTLYIAYKPVLRLTSKLKHAEGNEFEMIGKALDDRKAKIEEQEMLLLDLLLNNLLYKVPISKGKIRQLGIEPAECYTVFLLDGYVLSDAESRHVVSEAEEKFCKRLFVTDLEGEGRCVFVIFLKDNQIEELKKWLQKQCDNLNKSTCAFVGGKVVSDIKDIWMCFKECEDELAQKKSVSEAQKGNSSREVRRVKLREEIVAYVDAHYRDIDLTQVRMADHFNISAYTLSRIFRNEIGIGFVTYVNAKRVEHAKELLLTTKENVHDIAVMSGFDNDNNFFKVFKANTGMSPTTFRES